MTNLKMSVTPYEYQLAVRRYEAKFGVDRPKTGATWAGYLSGAKKIMQNNAGAN